MYINDYYPYYAKTMEQGEQTNILYGRGMNSSHISTIIRLYTPANQSHYTTNPKADTRLWRQKFRSRRAETFTDRRRPSWSNNLTVSCLLRLFDNGARFRWKTACSLNEKGKEVKQLPDSEGTTH